MTCFVCLATKPVGEPDAGNPHVRSDERAMGNGALRTAQAATVPIVKCECHVASGLLANLAG